VNLFRDIIYYFSVYKKYLGYRLYIVFTLTAMAVAAEGLGIVLLLPLLNLAEMDDGESELSGLALLLHRMLEFIGIHESLLGILLFIGFIFFIKGILKFMEGGYNHFLQAQLLQEIKSKMIGFYGGMDYRYYSSHNTGHFINIINAQINTFITSFEKYKTFISAAITTGAYLAFAFIINWKFAAMAVVAGVVIIILFKRLNNYVRELSRKTVREKTILNKFLVQTLQSFKYIASTAQMAYFKNSVLRSISRLALYMRNQGIADAFTKAIKEPVSVFLVLGIISVQITLLNANIAPLIVALILIYRSVGHIITIQSSWQGTMNKIGSLEMIENEFAAVQVNQEASGFQRMADLYDRIEFRQVNFSYTQNGEFILKNINLSIKTNTTVAFIGESGAGKTTLVDLLTLILRPREGEIIIDGIPHDTIDVESWRRQIGYVSQDTVVFDDTIANNICLWKGDYNREPELRSRIELAAERAFARKFIDQLPDGFNTMVGDRGIRVSGGQRQRLFIARELFKNPRLLILDEATSALDSESERYIQETINRLKGSTTVVIISHRLSSIRYADYIYVLDNGSIIEQGTYHELMSSNGNKFNKMVALQRL
jgi:ABC-type bacteriocin/lantibiotic exporter with double-glycine peptidase domain